MKIKSDFVTNSSSTAFVVMVPNSFHINEDEIKTYINNNYDETYEEAKEAEAFDEIYDCIASLKKGDNLWTYGTDGVHFTIYNSILDLCNEHKFILASLEMNGEGNNIIQGVKEEIIENMLINNMDVLSMFKSIQRNDKNDTSKNK